MDSKTIFRITAAASAVLAMSAAQAAPTLIYSSGYASGVTGLVVGDGLYDVSFVTGSYNTVFGADTPTFLNDAAGAGAASASLLAVLQGESSAPKLTPSRPNATSGFIFTPSAIVSGRLVTASNLSYGWQTASWVSDNDILGIDVKRNVNIMSGTYAVYSYKGQAAPIPEPSTWAMLGLGIAGLGLLRRGKKLQG